MKFFINKKRLLGVVTAATLASAALGIVPASAGLDEVLGDEVYTPPLAQEVNIDRIPDNPVKQASQESAARVEMEYKVRPGDTLWSIAERSGISVAKLALANHLSQEQRILVGQTITIPGLTGSYHLVAAGETLSSIAGRYHISEGKLVQVNNLVNPDDIRIGQQLMIPGEEPYRETAASQEQAAKVHIGDWIWPVAGEITSPFGIRGDRPHEGIDIGAEEGAVIHATERGRVVWAAPRGTYGLTVIIDHGNGIRSLYAHCSKLLVQEGQQVQGNQPIARVGNTGRSEGPHLHMEIRRQGIPLDPLMFLKDRLLA